jgi:hypothetical protein
VVLVHPQNGFNSLILNWCIGGCWFTPAEKMPHWTAQKLKNCRQCGAYFGSLYSEIDLAKVGFSDWCFGFSHRHTFSMAFQLLLVHT